MTSGSPYYASVPRDVTDDGPYSVVGGVDKPVSILGYPDFQYEIGRKGKAPGQFGGWVQHFTTSRDDKTLYVCDGFNKRIQVFDLPKRKPLHWFPTTMPGFNFQAQGIQVLRNGNLCVNCVGFDGTSRIGIFDQEGQRVHSFGPGLIGYSAAMTVDNMDRITIIDRRKMKISTFSADGTPIGSFDPGVKGDLLRICANSSGHLVVPNHLNNSVLVFDPYGTPIHHLRPLANSGYEFKYPAGVAVDCDDNILVCDVGNHRVLQFTSEGTFRTATLNKRDNKLWRPHDIVATYHGTCLISEVGQTFIKIFCYYPQQS